MNRNCETCSANTIPEDIRDEIFKLYFGKTIECPLDDKQIICFFSKAEIDWEKAFLLLRKKHEKDRKRGS
jgi:hypothetical protein